MRKNNEANDNDLLSIDGKYVVRQTMIETTATDAESGDHKFEGVVLCNAKTGIAIPNDEPLFLLRGKDILAARAIKHYLTECELNGVNEKHLYGVNQKYTQFIHWQDDNKDLVDYPD